MTINDTGKYIEVIIMGVTYKCPYRQVKKRFYIDLEYIFYADSYQSPTAIYRAKYDDVTTNMTIINTSNPIAEIYWLMGYKDISDTGDIPFNVQSCVNEIFGNFGDVVSVDLKNKSLVKYGKNLSLGTTKELVWLQGGTEVYATDNTIDTVSSSNASLSEDVVIEGHILSGLDMLFIKQTVSLNGQNKVPLPTPMFRVSRIEDQGTVDLIGDVYVYEDTTISNGVPSDATKIHVKMGESNKSLKCSTSISSTDYWIITGCNANVIRTQTRSVDFEIQVRQLGMVFKTQRTVTAASNSGSIPELFPVPLIIPPNSDVRVMARSSGSSTEVGFTLYGHLATII